MEQPRTNTAIYVIPMVCIQNKKMHKIYFSKFKQESEVPNTPESNPTPETTEFATKIQLKFDPLAIVDNSQRAAFERDSVFKKVCVFLFVLLICSIYNFLGFMVTYVFISKSYLNLWAAVFGVMISQLLLWPFARNSLPKDDYLLFLKCVLYIGLAGILCALLRCVYNIKRTEIQQQNNPNNQNDIQHWLE
ncbi:Hypothetical predicted protein [Cloeon dipterum]|uniref:Uncharacterized protein n=1 Tax=Cloeon dipterum TaxID=197152 RepID=A0A8S1DIE9_9INSE|nr:Hypothetical predicted protein [Cloeon dipterum]